MFAGISNGGTPRSGFGMSGQVNMGRYSIGGGFGNTGGFDVDTSGLKDLSKSIQTVVTDVNKLAAAVDKLTTKLTAAGTAAQGAFGGGQQGTSGKGLSVAPVSGGANYKGGGSGSSSRSLALGAAGEIGAQWAGQLNAGFASFSSSGLASNLQAAQAASIFGGSSKATSFTSGLSSLSVSDTTKAAALLQQNNFLYSGNNSQKTRQLKAFLDQAQKLNPTMGATGAMHFANDLTSNQAMAFMQNRGIASTGGGLYNAITGGINSPSTVYKTVLEGLTGQKNLTPQKAKELGQNGPAWQAVTNNAQQMGLSSADLVQLRQYATSGMSLTQATKSISGTTASHALSASSAKSERNEELYQQSTGSTNAMYNAQAGIDRFETNLAKSNGTIVNWAGGLAKGTSAMLGFVSHIAELGAAIEILTGKGGRSGGSGGGLLGNLAEGGIMGKILKGGGGAAGADAAAGTTTLGGVFSVAAPLAVASAVGWYGGHALNNLTGGAGFGGTSAATIAQRVIDDYKTASKSGNKKDMAMLVKDAKTFDALPSGLREGMSIDLPGMGDPPTGSTTTAGLSSAMKSRVGAMMQANPNIKITSGHRTSAQQAYLYAAKGGKGVAKPGQSAHQSGQAADLGPPSQFSWIAKNASKFGLGRPAPKSEPWHVQAMGDPTGGNVTGTQVIQKAETWLGTNYVYGGDGTSPGQGVDCSRFVQEVFASLGITLPRTTQEQCTLGTRVGGIGSAQPGDLIFYDYEGPNTHVAIYMGSMRQIAAPETGQKVQIQSIDAGHITQIRRIISGGAGSAVAAAAATAVSGTSATGTAASGGGASAPGLQNSFIAMVNSGGGWAGAGSPATAAATGASSSSSSSGSGSGTGSTTIVGGSSSVTSPTSFSRAVLAGLGIGATQTDVTSMNAWQQQEGQWTATGAYNAAKMHNPLNTRLNMAGSSDLGGKTTSYPTWAEGVQATVQTMKQSNMAPIVSALQQNDNLAGFSKALESTRWASSAYEGRSFPEPSGIYAMGDPVGSSSSAAPAPVSISRGGMGGSRSISVLMNIYPQQMATSDIQNVVAQLMIAVNNADSANAVAVS
jgi:cell wall-associated NlpC family hydrolase